MPAIIYILIHTIYISTLARCGRKKEIGVITYFKGYIIGCFDVSRSETQFVLTIVTMLLSIDAYGTLATSS